MKKKILGFFTMLALALPLLGCNNAPHTHNPAAEWSKDATFHWHACSGCSEKLDAAVHTWDEGAVVTPAGHDTPGSMKYTCTVCGEEKTEVIPPKGCTPVAAWSYDESNHWHKCEKADCPNELNLAPHTFGMGKVIKQATCEESGTMEYTCTVCGYKKTSVINPLGHSYGTPRYAWAKTAQGYKCAAAVKCQRDGCKSSVSEAVNAEYNQIRDPWCITEGVGIWTAEFESELFEAQEYAVSIEPLGHVWGDAVITWNEDGEGGYESATATRSCTRGGDCEATDEEDSISCTFQEIEAPTCSKEGTGKWTAKFAQATGLVDAVKEVSIPKIAHKDSEWLKDATSHWKVCPDCTEEHDKADHDFVDGECKVCGYQRVYTSLETIVKSTDTSVKYTTVGYVTAIYNNNSYQGIWIGNGEFGIQIYGHNNNKIKLGDVVEVIDANYVRDSSNRYIELTSPKAINVLSKAPAWAGLSEPVACPIDDNWATATKSIDNNTTLNRLVAFEGTLLTRPETISKSADSTLTGLDKGGKTVTVYIKKSNFTDELYAAYNNLVVGDKIKFTGAVGTKSGNTQIVAVSMPEFIEGATASAVIGGEAKYFYNLKDAVEAVPATGEQVTIELLKNVEDGCGIVVNEGQNIVFDLNGFTYTVHAPAVGSAGTTTLGFQLLKGCTVKFKDGTVNCFDTTGEGYVPLENDKIKILIQNYGNLSLENATIDHTKGKNALYAISNNCGSLTVDADSKIIAADGQVAFDLWFGMSPIYEDGITVNLPVVEDLGEIIVGKVEYGRDNHSAKYDNNWFNRTAVVIGEKAYRVKDELLPGKYDCTQFEDVKALVDALVEITIKLVSIDVDATEAKVEFKAGETFTYDGVVVTATYDDESTKVVAPTATDPAAGYEFTLDDLTDSKEVTVTYSEGGVEKTGKYNIAVKDNAVSAAYVIGLSTEELGGTVTVTGNVCAISTNAFMLADASGIVNIYPNAAHSYKIGDYVRATGVTAYYNGANQITKPTVVAGVGTDPKIEPAKVTLTAAEWDASTVLANGPVMVSGVAKVVSGNFQYFADGLDLTESGKASNIGYCYRAVDGTNFCISANEGKFIDFVGVLENLSSAGNRAIMPISWEEHVIKTTSIELKVNDSTADITLKPNETAQASAVCNPAGAPQDVEYVVADNEDGIIEVSAAGLITAKKAGEVTLTAKQGEIVSNEIKITVENVTISSIQIKGEMTKIAYNLNEDWDPAGLTVEATYSDSTTADVTSLVEWSYDPEKASATTITSVTVTATLGTLTDNKVVTVTVAGIPTYEKVKAAPADWSGTYILVYETDDGSEAKNPIARVWTGIDASNCYTAKSIASDKVVSGDLVTVTISKSTTEGKYIMKMNGGTNKGKFIAHASNSNGMTFGDSSVDLTITYEDGCTRIKNANGACITYNKTSGQDRFRFFKATSYPSQEKIQLYKLAA